MEIMFLFSKSPDGSHPAPAPAPATMTMTMTMTMLTRDQKWTDAPELGSAAMVANQDTEVSTLWVLRLDGRCSSREAGTGRELRRSERSASTMTP
jgi:hypothetical protein